MPDLLPITGLIHYIIGSISSFTGILNYVTDIKFCSEQSWFTFLTIALIDYLNILVSHDPSDFIFYAYI